MSDISNCLMMLVNLSSNRLISKKEFAEKLGVSERQVSRYKNKLSEIFNIESVPGPKGGYRIVDKCLPVKELLTEDEIMLLKLKLFSIDAGEDTKLKNAIDKINYSILNNEKEESRIQFMPYSRIKPQSDEFKNMQNEIYSAIINSNELSIEYEDNNGKKSKRDVQPYKFFSYKGETYLIANCLLRNEIRFFKLVRIKWCFVKTIKFEKTIDVDKLIKEYEKNNIGIFCGEDINIRLKIYHPIANTVKERIWVDNQVIYESEDGNIIFEAKMKKAPELLSWILSMINSVEILEPKELREEIKEILEKNLKKLK
ncbi:hypothetical protein HMPREF1092_02900 [Clostridium thermobutyricum]|uniref:HTH deoR-type domain-containing protein n=2 Tax=Clostridium thermobutyricum TaxID=29372 RepID=N9WA61_9CLOT|nr:hypothetical protein HMPREF1092_02900 [Clostridium thermobutyricum]